MIPLNKLQAVIGYKAFEYTSSSYQPQQYRSRIFNTSAIYTVHNLSNLVIYTSELTQFPLPQ